MKLNIITTRPPAWLNGTVAVLTVLALIGPAAVRAVDPVPSWPTSWISPAQCSTDISDVGPAEADLIGTSTSPAVGFKDDSNFFYFRERVDGNPRDHGGWKNTAWVVLVQTTPPSYQYLLSVNGDAGLVEIWSNTQPGLPVDFSPTLFQDEADTRLWSGSTATYAQSSSAGSGQYFVDWAIPKGQLSGSGITVNTTKFFATSQNSNNYNKDHLDCYNQSTDVTVVKTASPEPVTSGGVLTYTITVTNNGPESATGVVVTDVLPANVSYVSNDGGATNTSGTITWSVGSLANGASAALHVNVTVNSGTSVTNTASVVSTTTDPNTANNSSQVISAVSVPVNHAPVANAKSITTSEDTPVSDSVTASDVDGDSLTYTVTASPTNGSLTSFNTSTGAFTYTPSTNYSGVDSFKFKANDGSLDSNEATVSITVTPVNDSPVAVNDSYSTNEDTALVVAASGVLSNDTDVEGSGLTAVLEAGPTQGSLTLNADGSFSYTPNTDYVGADSFTYKAYDGAANSNVATVSITVNPVNDPPVANTDTYSTDEDTALVVIAPGVLSNDTDVDGDSLSASLVSGVSNGSLTLNADGSFSYTPNANFNGTDTFTYQANDGSVNSNVATVTITVSNVNDAPIANTDSYSVDEDTMLVIPAAGVLSNDTDIDSDPLTAIQVGSSTHGSVTLNADGSFTYTPNANYVGLDSFTYKVNDGTIDSGVAVVNITVNPVNDTPVANALSVTTPEDTAVSDTVTASDADGDTLTYTITGSGPAHGTLTSFIAATGTFTYTPNTDYVGPDSFTFKASDGTVDSSDATVTITVTPVNDPPILTLVPPDPLVITVGDPFTDPGATASDIEDGDITADIVVGGDTVNNNAVGSYTITYNVSDHDGAPAPQVTRTVNVSALPTGTLQVKKVISGSDASPDTFSFSVNGGTAQAFAASGTNNLTVSIGTYTVTEPAASGFTTTYDNCTEVSVTEDATTTCTVTNTAVPPTDENPPVSTFTNSRSHLIIGTEVSSVDLDGASVDDLSGVASAQMKIYRLATAEQVQSDGFFTTSQEQEVSPFQQLTCSPLPEGAVQLEMVQLNLTSVGLLNSPWGHDWTPPSRGVYCAIVHATDVAGNLENTGITGPFAYNPPVPPPSCTSNCGGGGGGGSPVIDLSLTMTIPGGDPASVGTTFTYSVTATNNGPTNGTNVVVTDILPGSVSYISSVAGQGSYDVSTGKWNIGTLPVGGSAMLQITGTLLGGGTISNFGSVTSSENDVNVANNVATHTFVLAAGTGPIPQVLGAQTTSLPRTGGMPVDGMFFFSWLAPLLSRFRRRDIKNS